MTKAQEEQIKLLAAFLNAIGAGTVVAGIIAPIAASILNPALPVGALLYFGGGCFGLSLVMHGIAQATLGRLQ